MSEIRERPDAPCGPGQVWERDDGVLFIVKNGEFTDALCGNRLGSTAWFKVTALDPGRYRLRTLDPLPWDEQEETKMKCERPDKPGIWQRKSDNRTLLWNGSKWTSHIEFAWHDPGWLTNEYRLIIDADGKLVCDPQSPWPEVPKVVHRRFMTYRCIATGELNVLVLKPNEPHMIHKPLLDEIRDCEVDEAGRVVRILEK